MASESKDILISVVKVPMITAGLWTRPLTNNQFVNKLVYIYSMFMRANYAVFYISLVAELIRLVTQGYTLQIILSSFGVCVNATKIAVKTIIYLKSGILDLWDDVIEREREIWTKNEPAILKLYLQKVKTGRVFGALLGISTIFAVSALNLTGAYGNEQMVKYNKAHNASLESHYMYQFWFPGNKLEHLNWVYTLSVFYSWAGTTYNTTTHVALVTLLVYLSSHLVLLQYRLRTYIPADLGDEQMGEMIRTLKGYILEHQYLISFSEQINDSCKSIIMMEFILSSFDVASVTINITKLGISDVIWLMIFFCLLVLQIFCLAWSCNEVTLESQNVADAAFESSWHLLNEDGKQLTQILMIRAQRPLQMTIGPFGPMTTQSFLMVMKAAYSYLSIMS